MSKTLNLTKKLLSELVEQACSNTRQFEYTDSQEPSLKAVVYPSGKVIFIARKTWKKQKHFERIGNSNCISIVDARAAAREFSSAIQLGRNPKLERQRESLQFGELAERYVTARSGKRSIATDRSRLKNHLLPAFGKKYAALIQPSQVERFHKQLLGTLAVATANRCLMLMQAIYNFGIKQGLVPDSVNPAKAVAQIRENNEQNRLLQLDQTELFLDGLKTLEPSHANLFEFLLLTGMRSSEARNLRSEDVTGSVAHLKLTKNGDSRDVPLSDRAMELVKEQLETYGEGPLFPGDNLKQPMAFPRRSWLKLMKATGLSLKPHDLRRTFVSRAIEKHPIERVAAIVGHRNIQTTYKRYIRHDPAALKHCAQSVADLTQTKSICN